MVHVGEEREVDRPGRHNTPEGWVPPARRIERATVDEVALGDFDIDDYRLRPAHHRELDRIVANLVDGLRAGRYLPQIKVMIWGETSSTATDQHNLELSRHRAYNVFSQIKCRVKRAGLTPDQVRVQWAPIGESLSQTALGENKEDWKYRGVFVYVTAPIPACNCPPPPPPQPPPPRGSKTIPLCVSVPRIAPRSSASRQPDILSLARMVAGLPAPAAIVTNAGATVQIENRSAGSTGRFELRGWGLEIALPSAASIDVRARLHATLEAIARASASLGASLRVGPFGISLRVDANGFAQALVQLVADVRAHIDFALRPNVPEPLGCTPLQARESTVPIRFEDFAGPALLMVPATRLGPATLHFASPAIARRQLQISQNPVIVPADKSTVRTLLVIAGSLRHVGTGAARREDESVWAQTELQPETASGETAETWAEAQPTNFESYAGV